MVTQTRTATGFTAVAGAWTPSAGTRLSAVQTSGDGVYVTGATENDEFYVTFSAFTVPTGATVNSVTVAVEVAAATASSCSVNAGLFQYSAMYSPTAQATAVTSFATKSFTFTRNPNTVSDWTSATANGLTRIYVKVPDATPDARVGFVSVTVDYTEPTYPAAGTVAAVTAVDGVPLVVRPTTGTAAILAGVSGTATSFRATAGVVPVVSGVVGYATILGEVAYPTTGTVEITAALAGMVTAHLTATATVPVVSGVVGHTSIIPALPVPADYVPPPVVIPAIDRKVRTLDARAELVDAAGTPVMVTVGSAAPRSDLPLAGARVSFKGEVAEQWGGTATWADPWMVPADPTHPLWGARNLYVRLWWRILDGAVWVEHLVCTLAIGNSGGQDSGTISGTVNLRDVLSTARGGYGGALDVGGMTVPQALRAIFERVAPALPLQIGDSTVTLPTPYTLAENDPAKDWTEIAALAGWVVRTDREGTVICGPRPTPTVALDWAEGPDCPVTDLSWSHGIEHMGNRITVRSTHPDAVGVWATAEDTDPASPTWVGGPWGVHPLPDIDSDAVATVEAATNLARMHLGRGLHPVEDVSVVVPQRPDLTYRHPIHLARAQAGIGATYEVSSWDLDLPVRGTAPATMPVRMMQRTVEA